MNERWAGQDGDAVVALVRALLRASRFCAEPANASRLAAMLARPAYLDVPEKTVLASLLLDRQAGVTGSRGESRPAGWRMRSFDATFPSVTRTAWIVTQMQRWSHVDPAADAWAIAGRATDAAVYRVAARSLSIDCPPTDAPPMRLRDDLKFERPAAATPLRKEPAFETRLARP